MRDYFVGIDGGGTRTTIGIGDATGRELLRQVGPPGLVDANRPAESALRLVDLVRVTLRDAGYTMPARALCAGLAGVGNAAERSIVESKFANAGLANEVAILSDGETALYGALGGRAGILLVAGTGSIAFGRSEDGRVERCGGWGLLLGDEGSGFAIGRAGLQAALRSVDGRVGPTRLLTVLLESLGVNRPEEVPPWASRAAKRDIGLLAVRVLDLAGDGDAVARAIVGESAIELAAHFDALERRLGPWSGPPAVALHGGVANHPVFASLLTSELLARPSSPRILSAVPDAVTGALEYARRMIAGDGTTAGSSRSSG